MADFHATATAGLQPGSGASLTIDALQDRRLHGQVDALSPASASEFSLLAGGAGGGNVTTIVQRLPERILIDPGPGPRGDAA
ncbi:hypothetical protein [Paracoccus hibiscisoli]|uniref:Uncharacterized protein n=1 Tax=Paracoccus hibiscisoli TaxID=2023261 RepID=A0A4U0QRC8_9RHOB|nr:hypothetical protein [Paracoccus hibiscisoli]TJZ84529.1 hypothetical protein FA740_08655 [Paracoccus hibiscisoli]